MICPAKEYCFLRHGLQPLVSMSFSITAIPLPRNLVTSLTCVLSHNLPANTDSFGFQALEGIDMRKWVINVVPPLDDWTTGRAVLFGDAVSYVSQISRRALNIYSH